MTPTLSAVILDLSRVGGHFHAAICPASITRSKIWDIVRPLIYGDIEEPDIYVACQVRPLREREPIRLQHGDVLTVTQPGIGVARPTLIDHLFHPNTEWGRVDQIPQAMLTPAIGYLLTTELHALREHHFDRASIDVALGSVLGLDPPDFIRRTSFAFDNLAVDGYPCDRFVATAQVPRPSDDRPHLHHRRDIFVFCDVRPLGMPPRAYFSHSRHVHLPTLALILGIDLPEGYSLHVVGCASLDADEAEIKVFDGTVLVFRAMRRSHPSHQSSDSGPSHPGSDHPNIDDPDLDPPQPWDGFQSPRPTQRDARSRSPHGPNWGFYIHLGSSQAKELLKIQDDINCPDWLQDDLLSDLGSLWDLTGHTQGLISCKQPDGDGHPNTVTGLPRRETAALRVTEPPVARLDPFAPIDAEAHVAALTGITDQGHYAWINAMFLVLAPDRVPDVMNLPLQTPCWKNL